MDAPAAAPPPDADAATPNAAAATPGSGGMVADLLAGSGLGLMLGTVLGLSATPVVAGFVGGITSLLAIFLGLDGGEGKLARLRINGARIGSFGLAAVIGVALGLYVRINNPLAEPPQRQLERWQAAFPGNPELAAQMMVYERTRLEPAALRYSPAASATPVKAGAGAATMGAVLFSSIKGKNYCRDMTLANFGNDVGKLLAGYENRGGALAVVAAQVTALPKPQQASALEAVHTLVCELEKEEK